MEEPESAKQGQVASDEIWATTVRRLIREARERYPDPPDISAMTLDEEMQRSFVVVAKLRQRADTLTATPLKKSLA